MLACRRSGRHQNGLAVLGPCCRVAFVRSIKPLAQAVALGVLPSTVWRTPLSGQPEVRKGVSDHLRDAAAQGLALRVIVGTAGGFEAEGHLSEAGNSRQRAAHAQAAASHGSTASRHRCSGAPVRDCPVLCCASRSRNARSARGRSRCHQHRFSAPGCISTAVSVGSTEDLTDAISSFSNTAPFLSLLAPGSVITSSVPGAGFGSMRGTSMATPHVAGAWAVLRSRKPAATVSQVLGALQNSGVSIRDTRPGGWRSFNRIQIDRVLSTFSDPDPQMSLDLPTSGASLSQPFLLAGWALDRNAASGTGVDAIHVWAQPSGGGAATFIGTAAYGGSRPDVAAVLGAQFTNCGFNLNVTTLAPVPTSLWRTRTTLRPADRRLRGPSR
jgi:hypothetical protein